ncbi:MAG TPA: CPBP family glutamic-type intramembrane protease, partial [Blastocatellia bacterium]|nr:CPBP family glutamic-type intramembrane protease [Blastocatellia bacterium]
GLVAGTLRVRAKFFSMLLFVPPWALLQQYMLLAFAHRRFRVITGSGRVSVIASAGLFAILHLPNPVLTVVCALGGLIWAREYERDPNLFAHAITHTVASAFLANSLPGWLLKNMVVGYNYFLR